VYTLVAVAGLALALLSSCDLSPWTARVFRAGQKGDFAMDTKLLPKQFEPTEPFERPNFVEVKFHVDENYFYKFLVASEAIEGVELINVEALH
jgi:hypothetical protein